MLEFQERVVAEQKELELKISKLSIFIHTSKEFKLLPVDEQGRLRMQHHLMSMYDLVLKERIANFYRC